MVSLSINHIGHALVLAVLLFMAACTNEGPNAPNSGNARFEQVPASETGIDFQNSVKNTRELNIFKYRNFYNGGGVAIGDLNNDDLPDIYFTNNTGSNRLYLNKGDFRFEDITESAGVGGTRTWSTGVVMADVNDDGLLDIYVCNAGYIRGEDQDNELFINNGDLTFTEKANDYNLNEGGYTTHAAFYDYDTDGDLDAYILNNSFMPVNTLNYSNKRELKAEDWPVKDFLKGGGDKLLRNDNGKYVDVTEDAGIYSSLIGFGLGITIGDVNGDMLPDMYVSNDFFERDYLYINNGDGTFTEDIKNWINHLSLFSMGADMADINNDGYPEIFVTDMLPDTDRRLKTTSSFEPYRTYDLKLKRDFYHQFMQNTLQLNNTDNTFSEIAYFSGVARSDWSWGALMFDMDNDGFRDIYICNGIYQDVTDQDFIDFFANDIIQRMVLTGVKEELDSVLIHMPSKPILNKAFRNNGELQFEDVGEQWGFNEPSFSNGGAYADLDRDGDLDLVINNLNQEAFVYRNRSNTLENRHYLKVRLEGLEGNRFAVGSKVRVHTGPDVRISEVIPSRGFQSSIEYDLTFGLGEISQVDSVVVVWPDRQKCVVLTDAVDTLLRISRSTCDPVPVKRHGPTELSNTQGLLSETKGEFLPHQEDEFVDFYYEGLLVKKLSREGPCIAVGDVNGDGTEDLFVGSSAGHQSQLYLQKNGEFMLQDVDAFAQNRDFEDTAAEFFDVDNDGDLDLYVGSGGNHAPANSRNMHDRLYVNDGNGIFTLDIGAIPSNGFNTAVVVGHDITGDGFLDLIVLSRSYPQNYGVDPVSYVFINKGNGKFEDRTEELAKGIREVGMVTDAAIVDLIGDSMPELLVVGEWMAPRVFDISNGRVRPVSTALDAYSGWWNTVRSADLDGDGDVDLVLGNLGENFYLTASDEQPLKLWVSDFDENGTIENITSRTIDGRDVPVPLKKELTEQLSGLKKKSLKHSDYADKSIQELFTGDQLKEAVVKTAVILSSVIAWNEGDGDFQVESLPPRVQLSCVCDISCTDLDNDGNVDIVLGGNDYGFAPQFSRLDGSYGHVLLNRGDREFALLPQGRGGFFVRGQVRAIRKIDVNGTTHLIVAVNDEAPRLFKLTGKQDVIQ